jgi:hypothetical protein
MSQIMPNRSTNDVEFAIKNRDTSTPAMQFQAHIGAQCQTNVVALRALKAKLPSLDTGKLLQGAMIDLDQPGVDAMCRSCPGD